MSVAAIETPWPAARLPSLDAVFRGRYLTTEKQCKGVGPSLPSSRQAGDFTPSVFEQATGSFTAPRRTHTLYLINDGERAPANSFTPP